MTTESPRIPPAKMSFRSDTLSTEENSKNEKYETTEEPTEAETENEDSSYELEDDYEDIYDELIDKQFNFNKLSE